MENLLEKVKMHNDLDTEIKEYLKPKLIKLLLDGRLNKGKYNKNRKLEETINILSFYSDKNTITVEVEIWWSGYCADWDAITLTVDEWENIN